MRSTTLAAPLLLALQREILEREAWPALRTALPGQAEGYWAAARDVHLDSLSPGEQAETRDRRLPADDPGAREHERAGGRRPGAAWRARRARGRRCASWRCSGAGAGRCGRPRRARSRRGWRRGDFAALVERALFLDRDDPVAAWGELRARQARLIERLAGASELRIEAEGTDLRAERRRAHVGELRRQPQHALGRGLHGPGRGLRRGPRSASRSPRARAGWRSRASSSSSAPGAWSRRAPTAARPTCARRSPPTPARRCSARSGSARTSASTARSGRSCSTRRSAARCTSRSAARIPRRAA